MCLLAFDLGAEILKYGIKPSRARTVTYFLGTFYIGYFLSVQAKQNRPAPDASHVLMGISPSFLQ